MRRGRTTQTISEITVIRSDTPGGASGCSGNLSANQCTGSSIVEISISTSTSFIFPRNAAERYFNATITQSTRYGELTCGNYSTTTITLSYNKMTSYGAESVSWRGSCY